MFFVNVYIFVSCFAWRITFENYF